MKKITLLGFIIIIITANYIRAQKTISGTVLDEKNNPLAGANIIIKGTTHGTITNSDGYYFIEVRDDNSVLQFSFIGYLSEEVQVGSQSEINVMLIPNISDLQEVVVIGYGSIKKRDLTASVASVNSEQLKDIPLSSSAQVMTGRLAGVQITTSEGSPDAEVRIRVRGGGSITQDNSPLYIVDGFPVESISDVAPSDIASIDVLKDASSTAIYGARGANGVIIISTKKGAKDRTTVNYNYYTGIKTLSKKLDVLDPNEFVLYQYERSQSNFQDRNSFENYFGTWEQLDSLYSGTEGTDWQEEVFGSTDEVFNKMIKRFFPNLVNKFGSEDMKELRVPTITAHNLSINGGTDKMNYNLSYTNHDEDGIMIESGYQRNNVNFRFNVNATEKLSLEFDARYSDQKVQGSGTSDPGSASQNRLRHSVTYRPVNGLYDFTNDPELEFDDDEYYSASNLTDPVQLAKDEYRFRHTIISNFNAALNYEIIKGLIYRTDAGYLNRQYDDDRFYGLTTYLARRYEDKPVVRVADMERSVIRWANTLTYYKTLSDHDFTLLLGQELVHTKENEFSQETRNYPESLTPELALGMMGLGENPQTPETNESLEKLFSLFGRVMYNYRDKYLAQFSYRADGSTKFHKSHPWGIFPSISAGWRISEENFMQDVSFISNLKLRASYGKSGNNRIDNYLFVNRFVTSTSKPVYLNESPTSYLYRPDAYNPSLKWETTITRDIGLDIGLFDNRLNASFDYYYNSTNDLLVNVSLDPSSTGYENQVQNIGATTNYGFEATIDAYIIDRRDFKLSANFNIAMNRGRVDKLADGVEVMYITSGWNDNTGADYIVIIGEPVGLMYGFVTDGYYTVDDFMIDPETGEFLLDESGNYILRPGVADNRNIQFSGFGPGSYRLRNLADPLDSLGNPYDDGSLVTFEDDRTVIGNTNPKHIGGLNIMMQYKNIDLSIFMNWVYGNDIYNANKIEFTSGYNRYTNLLSDVNSSNRWMTVNENGEVVTDPVELANLNANATTWKPQTGRYLFHSWAVEDGSFLRINNVTLGYTLPKSLTTKAFITNFRIYFTVNNLYTFTRYSGFDPEVNVRTETPMTAGVDYSAYPRSRMYLIGLNITF
ncbi:MAG: TonB-dependent receptor [Bacteroidales bacterium]|nr:TonB-dependent receptor [Bacteroidales bacterium]